MNAAHNWQRITIAGREADLFQPDQSADDKPAILFLHDFDAQTLMQSDAFAAQLARRGWRAVCPIADRCWWTETPCPDFDPTQSPLAYVRQSVLPFLRQRCTRIGLLGIGMGGQGVLQLAYRWPADFPIVAAIAPAVDFHNWYGYGLSLDQMFLSREAARQQTATLHVHPLNWPKHQFFCCDPRDEYWFEGCDRLAMKLSSMGIPHERDLATSAGGHTWSYFERMAGPVFEFLAARLA